MDLTMRRNTRIEEEQNQPPTEAARTLYEDYTSVWGSSRTQMEQIDVAELRMYIAPDGKPQPYHICEGKVKALMLSISDNGMLQPLVVRRLNNDSVYSYEVIVGNSRLTAAVRLGWNSVPCVIQDMTDSEAYDKVCQSNIQRHYDTLLPSELANLYQGYMECRGDTDDTVKFIADRFNTSVRSVYRYVGLLKLPDTLIQAVDDRRVPFGRYEQLLKELPCPVLEVIGEYVLYYRTKLDGKTIRRLVELYSSGFVFDADKLDALHEALTEKSFGDDSENENDASEAACPASSKADRLYATLRAMYPNKFVGLTDSEVEEYIIRIVSAAM